MSSERSIHSLEFEIPGDPVAFARSGGHGTIRFTPTRQRDFMALVKLCAAQAMKGAAPITGALEICVTAHYTPPMSWSKKRRAAAFFKTTKPDVDNVAKIIKDALNTLAYVDDAQVSDLISRKRYGKRAYTRVLLSKLAEEA